MKSASFLFSAIILLVSNYAVAQSFSESGKMTASDGAAGANFGYSVGVSGQFAVAGSPEMNGAGTASGAVYVYKQNGSNWSQIQKLTASDAATNCQFGHAVALEGTRLVIGAFGDNNYKGAAYVFEYNGTQWVQKQKLVPFDGAAADFYGYSVSISGDRIVVGSRYDDDNGTSSGSAYVYKYNGNSWVFDQKLIASDGAANDDFGVSVSISDNHIIVGAYANDDNGAESGSAYVFTSNGTNWSETQKITASDAAAGDYFGFSVSISGNNIIAGASKENSNGSASGAAYLFSLNGSTWTETQKLTASDAAADDQFGYSVSISGNMFIAGAYGNSDAGTASGSAYIFKFNGTNWSEIDQLTASDADTSDYFGYSVCINSNQAIVGAYQNSDNGVNSGSAYLFDDPTANLDDFSLTGKDLKIYPNPSNGHFQIALSDNSIESVKIINSLGQTVPFTKTDLGDSNSITVNAEAGVYLLKLTHKSGIITKPFIVQNN